MARQVRIEYPGAVYHVLARGDRREPIVQDAVDREFWLYTLGEMCNRSGCLVHAYVLLDNHYHVVLETPEGNLVEAMRWFQNSYTRRFNVRHRLWGHVFGGRYKALVVDPEGAYFRKVVDYVHLNPARAGLTSPRRGLERYPWSSLPSLLKQPRRRPGWLVFDRLFASHGLRDTPKGRRAYLEALETRVQQEGVQAGRIDPEADEGVSLQTTIRRGWYFGSQDFRDSLISLLAGDQDPAHRRPEDGYHGDQHSDHGQARAQAILDAAPAFFDLPPNPWEDLPMNDPQKAFVAEAIAGTTSMRLDWIRAHLHMGSRPYCSRLINARRGALQKRPKLRKERDQFLKMTRLND